MTRPQEPTASPAAGPFAGGEPFWKYPVELSADEPASRGARRLIGWFLDEIERNAERVRADPGADVLHDLRVATRRCRSLLSHFGKALASDAFDRRAVRAYGRRLADFARRTGRLRDLDVFLEQLSELDASTPPAWVGALEKERQAEREQVLAAIADEGFDRLLSDGRELVARPSAGAAGGLPVSAYVARRLAKARRRVGDALADCAAGGPPALHRTRVQAKKLRYLLEAASGLFPAGLVEARLADLRQLQERLGRLQDLAVQVDLLEGLRRDGVAGDRAAALAERFDAERRRLTERALADLPQLAGVEDDRRWEELAAERSVAMPRGTVRPG